MRTARRIAVMLAVGVGSLGCASPQDQGRPDPDRYGGKADLSSWIKLRGDVPECGKVITGQMQGTDSAHAFAFEATADTVYAFEYSASYRPDRGAVVAVYGPQGNVLRRERNRYSQDAGVSFVAQTTGTHHVAVYSVTWAATGDYALRTSCGLSGLNQLSRDQTAFSTFERKRIFWRDFGPRSMAAESATDAPQGRTGDVEEGDVYRVDGDRLYYFNTYRGLMIFDISDPKAPTLKSRVPVYGYPIEMYIQNSTVYALIRDALYVDRAPEGTLRFERRNVSQLVTIAVPANLDAQQPQVLQTHDIVGQLREGVSRKVGDTIYVVSYQPSWYFWGWQQDAEQPAEQAWVYSFNVADPTQVKLADQLQVFSGGRIDTTDANGTQLRENFNDVAISATANALMVVENWSSYSYKTPGGDFTCSQSQWLNKAKVSIVDISNPAGQIRLHTKFETYGQLGDQFKQTYTVEGGKATYLGIFARREWKYSDCTGTSQIENALEAWDVSNGASPQRLDRLSFGKPDETVRGSVFDTDRDVAFAITARNVDPLYAIDFSNPAQLKVLSEIDGLSGDMTVFRAIADGKFLVGIGRDNSDACTGFDSPASGWATKVAVSLIDVQDLTAIRLVQRQCVAVKGADWIGSDVTWNLDQAHKMIGMHSDGLVNAITVPVYYSKRIDDSTNSWWWYRHETAVGVMSWDLTKYDPALPPASQQVLQNHGTVVHPNGQVRRSALFTHKATTTRRKLLNLSDTHLSLVDLQDLDNPTTDAVVELAPYVAGVHRFGGYVVEQVRSDPWSWAEGDASEFRVRQASGKVEDNPVLASFTVSQVEQALAVGDALVLIRRVREPGDETTPWSQRWSKQALVYDLQNPLQPVLAGAAELPMSYISYYRFWCGTPPFWFGYADANGFAAVDEGVVFLSSEYAYDTGAQQRRLVLLDLRNLNAPQVVEQPLPADTDLTLVGIAADARDDAVLVSYKKRLGDKDFDGTTFEEQQYFVQRWQVSNGGLLASAPLNVPGRLVKATRIDGQPLLLTQDEAFAKTADGLAGSPRLNLLRETLSGTAQLRDSQSFHGMYLKDLVLAGNTLYVNGRESSGSWGPWPGPILLADGAASAAPQASGDQLLIYRLGTDAFSRLFGEDTGANSLEIMGVHDGRLFLSLSGDGVLVVDVSAPASPLARQFVRTLGYATNVEFVGSSALVAAGYYGLYQIELNALTKM